MAHPKYAISGIKIDKGNITLTYNDKLEKDKKEENANGEIQNSGNSTDND